MPLDRAKLFFYLWLPFFLVADASCFYPFYWEAFLFFGKTMASIQVSMVFHGVLIGLAKNIQPIQIFERVAVCPKKL